MVCCCLLRTIYIFSALSLFCVSGAWNLIGAHTIYHQWGLYRFLFSSVLLILILLILVSIGHGNLFCYIWHAGIRDPNCVEIENFVQFTVFCEFCLDNIYKFCSHICSQIVIMWWVLHKINLWALIRWESWRDDIVSFERFFAF